MQSVEATDGSLSMSYASIDEFELGDLLAEGKYGIIVNCVRLMDRKEFVMKFFGYTSGKPDQNWILREITNLRMLVGVAGASQIEATFYDTPDGLLNVKGHFKRPRYRKRYPVIVMEKLKGGDLFDHIATRATEKRPFSERDASKIFRNIIVALNEIHYSKNMINCDLKVENIVFEIASTDEYPLKIVDFGLSVPLWDCAEYYDERLLGTPAYLAPESIVAHEATGEAVYSRATDIWQAGCILYMIICAQQPFGVLDEYDDSADLVLQNIKEGRYTLDAYLSPEVKDLLNRMFCMEPNDRITGVQIMEHPWIANAAAVSDEALPLLYRNRIKAWSLRKRFKDSIGGSRKRKCALERVLERGAGSTPTQVPTTESNACGKGPMYCFPERRFMCFWETDEIAGLRSSDALKGAVVINANTIHKLKKTFLDYIQHSMTSAVAVEGVLAKLGNDNSADLPGGATGIPNGRLSGDRCEPPDRKRSNSEMSVSGSGSGMTTPASVSSVATSVLPISNQTVYQSAIRHQGMNIETFLSMIVSANLSIFASREIFDIFDWNEDGLVDYMEFLLTLSCCRSDVNWTDPESVSKMYFDIFDVDSSGCISREALTLVVSKLLAETASDEAMMTDLADSPAALDHIFRCVDTNQTGIISFDDFKNFIHVVLDKTTMRSAMISPR
jgi:serine/threonine protein kinase